jgi:hypothetical protein
MIQLNPLWQCLYGAGRLALFKHDGLAFFDPSPRAARRSFGLWGLFLPLWLLLKGPLIKTASEEGVSSPFMILAALTVVAVVSMLLQLIVVYRAASQMECTPRFPLFVTVTNASTIISLIFLLVAVNLGQAFLPVGSQSAYIYVIFVQAYLIAYAWFVAHVTLRVSLAAAAIMTALQLCTAFIVQYAFALQLGLRFSGGSA